MLTSIAKVFKVNIFSPSAMNPGRRLLNLIVIKIRLFTLRRRRIKNKSCFSDLFLFVKNNENHS